MRFFPTYLQIVISFLLFLLSVGVGAQTAATPNEGSPRAIRPVVVIVSLTQCCANDSWPEAEEKIRQEFVQSGVEVISVEGNAISESERRIELATIAEQYQAAAAIRILKIDSSAQKTGVDLWINDRVTQKTVYRFLPIEDTSSKESAMVAALKTAELFKGSLQEFHLSKQPPDQLPASIETMIASPAHPMHRRKQFRLGGGFSGLFFARDVGARGAPTVSLAWTLVNGFVIQTEGWFGIVGKDIVRGNNRSRLFMNCFVLKPMWEMRAAKIIRPALGATLGVAFIFVEGRSDVGQEEFTDEMKAFYWGMTAQVGFALSPSFWITPTFDIGAITPRAAIVFDTTEVARFGTPVLKGGLLLDVHF